MSKMLKTVLAIALAVIMLVGMFPLTAHAAEDSFLTVKFDMPEGCTYPIYVEVLGLDNGQKYYATLNPESDYMNCFTVAPGEYAIRAMVQGDTAGRFPIHCPDTYVVTVNEAPVVALSFSQEIADKIVEDAKPPVTEPSEPDVTEPDITEPDTPVTAPEKEPEEEPNKPVVKPSTPSENTQEEQENEKKSPFSWGPFIRGGVFVALAGVVALVVVIKKKRDEAAYGGDDD